MVTMSELVSKLVTVFDLFAGLLIAAELILPRPTYRHLEELLFSPASFPIGENRTLSWSMLLAGSVFAAGIFAILLFWAVTQDQPEDLSAGRRWAEIALLSSGGLLGMLLWVGIALTGIAVDALRRHRARQAEEALSMGAA